MNFINDQATDAVFCVVCAAMNINENDVGAVYYRVSTDSAILDRAAAATAGSAFSPTFAIIVTWHKLAGAGNGDLVSLGLLLCQYMVNCYALGILYFKYIFSW